MATDLKLLLGEGENGQSIRALLLSVRKRLWLILSIVVAIPALTGFVVSKQPKIFRAQTSLIIESSVPQYLGANFKDVVELETSWWNAQETLQTELRVIQSHSQAAATAQALCDRRLPGETEPALRHLVSGVQCNDPAAVDRTAPLLQALVQVDPQKESRVVNLVVELHDPAVAALVANTAAQVYTQRNLEHRLAQSEGAATWLGDEYGDLTRQLNEAERALIEFKQKNNVVAVAIEDQQNDLSSRHKKLSDELSSVQVKLIALRANRDLNAKIKNGEGLEDLPPAIADSPVMMRLKEMYVDQFGKLLEIRGKYLDKHPTVVAQEARVDSIREDLKREAVHVAKNIDAQYDVLTRQERDLKGALDAATHEALQLEQRAIEYNRLKRNFDRLAKLSEQVGGRDLETSVAGHLKTNNVRILDPANPPTSAVSPNVVRATLISVVIALFLGIGLAILLDWIDSAVHTQEDVETATGLVFLGLIPRIGVEQRNGNGNVSKDLFVIEHPKSPIAECCRAIRTNLLFMSPDRPAKTLLVTSAAPQEGKTTTAVNLAITMAQSGLRVLLVDTDMRRPRLHKAFGMATGSEGISSATLGEGDALDMVRDTGIPNLWLLPCGPLPPNPAELMHAERFQHIVSLLADAYDRVIFDSPPVGAVTDAAILARLTHGTVLVAKSGSTSKDTLRVAKRLLSDGKVNLLGCVLNDFDLAKHRGYGYYYYSKYGYYGGTEDESATTKVSSSAN
jgi:capsular exopolysaccharide synthesis family protein